MLNILVIGDPHFKTDNVPEVELFIEKITELAKEKKPDIIIMLGDLLHEHERIHTVPLNLALKFINKLRNITKTYLLVGNHDMVSHLQFLNNNHWMNALKEWENVTVVDKAIYENILNEEIIFVPYVPPGRFEEALNTLSFDWKKASCIFAHQEFYGCKMGAIISEIGDKWNTNYPNIISGHIHSKQRPQENIYYTGSAMQNAFGESEENIIAYVKMENKSYEVEEIDLGLPRKKIIYMDVKDIQNYNINNNKDKLKISISGEYEEFKSIKKTKKYKELINNGLKVTFKVKKTEKKIKNDLLNKVIEDTKDLNNFQEILKNIVDSNNNTYLTDVYEIIMNKKN